MRETLIEERHLPLMDPFNMLSPCPQTVVMLYNSWLQHCHLGSSTNMMHFIAAPVTRCPQYDGTRYRILGVVHKDCLNYSKWSLVKVKGARVKNMDRISGNKEMTSLTQMSLAKVVGLLGRLWQRGEQESHDRPRVAEASRSTRQNPRHSLVQQ